MLMFDGIELVCGCLIKMFPFRYIFYVENLLQ